MAHELVLEGEARNATEERSIHLGLSSSEVSSLFHRKIEFHPARKPFNGFSNGRGDFQLETLNPSCSDPRLSGPNPGQFSVKGKKADELEFLEHGLDPDLSFEITFRRIGAGLENLGNTCFLNSVVQCLTYTEPLVAYLQSGKHQSSCHIAGFCALCAIQKHVSRALQSSGRILAPKDLVSNLRCISRNFRNARQEDAHEYMVNLLESMHKCCLPSGVPSESPIAFEKSLVHKIFGGRLRSQVKCMQCSFCSNKFDPFLDLSLDIVKTDSVMKSLKNFTAAELLDGGEKQYQCQLCKQKVRALKQLTVYKAPYVLTIHLKRFHSHNPDAKIHKKIHFESSLDLKNYVSGSYDGDLKYTLYGVLVHRGGSTHSGHYYCYVRTSSGMWYGLDDNRVFHVKESVVLEQQAYMLFYVRDRKNVVLQKPANVDMEENMQANTNQKLASMITPLKNPAKNGLTENKLNGPGSSINITGKDNSSYALPKTIISNDVSVQPDKVIVSEERKSPKQDSILVHSSAPLLKKVPSENISIPRENHGEHLARSAELEPKNNAVTPDTENVTTGAAHVEINAGSNIDSNADFLALAATPNASNFKSSLLEFVIDEKSRKDVNLASSQSLFNRSDNMDLHNVPKEGKSTVSKDDTNNGSEKLVLAKPIKLSISSTASIGSVHSKVLDKPCRKLKKKLLKYQISSMRLRSNIILWGSLSVNKRKKRRRSKCRVRKCSKGDLIAAECLSDMGPSTSDKSESVFNNPSRSKKMKKTTRPLERANNAVVENVSSDLIFEEFKNKIDRGDFILSGDQCQKGRGCGSKSNPGRIRSARESKRDILNDDLTSVLSRGLQETVVAGWDGIDLPQSQILETNGESVSIGYIGDEWDKEYDRGKRKKVRNCEDQWFGGLNPFQEIADQKSLLKKAKMDQSSSGNRPFRI